jgi:hypothetical protein
VELGAIAVPFGNGAGAGTVDGAILGAGNHQNRAGNGRDIDSRRPVIVEHPEEHLEHHPARFRTQAVEDPVLRLRVELVESEFGKHVEAETHRGLQKAPAPINSRATARCRLWPASAPRAGLG